MRKFLFAAAALLLAMPAFAADVCPPDTSHADYVAAVKKNGMKAVDITGDEFVAFAREAKSQLGVEQEEGTVSIMLITIAGGREFAVIEFDANGCALMMSRASPEAIKRILDGTQS